MAIGYEEKEAQKALVNEVMWLVYFCIAVKTNGKFEFKKGNKTISIDENYMVSLFDKNGGKLRGLISEFGITKLSEMSKDISEVDSKMDKARKFFVTDEWHKALMDQTKKYVSNQSLKYAKSNNIKVVRQQQFYEKTKIDSFLKIVFKTFGLKQAKYDRWNPADVWFYRSNAISAIIEYIDNSSIRNSSIFNSLKKVQQKSLCLTELVGLNRLILNLFKSGHLIPLSLKKPSGRKGVYSYRLAKVNIPVDDKGKPSQPKVQNIQHPIKTFNEASKFFVLGESGTNQDLEYKIEVDQPLLNTDGSTEYVKEIHTLKYDAKNKILYVLAKGFETARSGSAGLEIAEKIVYTASAAREIKQIRKNVFGSPLTTQILSRGMMKGSDPQDQIEKSFTYSTELAYLINPNLRTRTAWIASAEENRTRYRNDRDTYVTIQNKMELACAIERSNIKNEIVLDLWSAIIGKGITNRKDYQKLIERVGNYRYKQSQKLGSKKLSKEKADLEAMNIILTGRTEGNPSKIPGGFHLKLY